jgi:hypothetical protein
MIYLYHYYINIDYFTDKPDNLSLSLNPNTMNIDHIDYVHDTKFINFYNIFLNYLMSYPDIEFLFSYCIFITLSPESVVISLNLFSFFSNFYNKALKYDNIHKNIKTYNNISFTDIEFEFN